MERSKYDLFSEPHNFDSPINFFFISMNLFFHNFIFYNALVYCSDHFFSMVHRLNLFSIIMLLNQMRYKIYPFDII